MANEQSASKTAAVMSTGAAIAATLAWLASRKVVGAEPGTEPGEFVLPEEFIALIVAIANDSNAILQQLHSIDLSNLTLQGWPTNTARVRTIVVTCVVANTAYRSDHLYVPDGMSLIIKSYPLNAVGTLVRVATSQFEATSIEMSYPLLPNEAVAYHVKDAHEFWVSSTVAGSIVVFSTEQEV